MRSAAGAKTSELEAVGEVPEPFFLQRRFDIRYRAGFEGLGFAASSTDEIMMVMSLVFRRDFVNGDISADVDARYEADLVEES